MPGMDERQIRAVLKVAECGSITSAASKLFMSVQGLKRQLDAMEQEELGCALFTRTSTGVILTEQGKTFCDEAPALLAQMEGFIERVRSAQSLQLRIAVWSGKQIPMLDAICAEYCRQLPECSIVFVPANQERAIEDIEEGAADISFQSRETGVVDESRLSYASVGISMSFKCVMAPSNPLVGKASVEKDDLAPYPLAAAGGVRAGLVAEDIASSGHRLREDLELRALRHNVLLPDGRRVHLRRVPGRRAYRPCCKAPGVGEPRRGACGQSKGAFLSGCVFYRGSTQSGIRPRRPIGAGSDAAEPVERES